MTIALPSVHDLHGHDLPAATVDARLSTGTAAFSVQEARMPTAAASRRAPTVPLLALMTGNGAIVALYIGLPIALVLREYRLSLPAAILCTAVLLIAGIAFVLRTLRRTVTARRHAEAQTTADPVAGKIRTLRDASARPPLPAGAERNREPRR